MLFTQNSAPVLNMWKKKKKTTTAVLKGCFKWTDVNKEIGETTRALAAMNYGLFWFF